MVDVVTQVVITVKKEDRVHQYYCANNCGLGEVYDVLKEMTAYIHHKINEVEKAQVPVEEPPKEA